MDDPRIPNPPGVIYPDMWKDGYAAALADMDAGLFDRPSPDDVRHAANYGYAVEPYFNGHENVKGAWVIVGHEGEVYGGVVNTKREAEIEAVRRWREEISL